MALERTVTVIKNFEQITEAIEQEAADRALRCANEVRTVILDGMREPKSGRRYRVPGTKRFYTASAPGEFPANRTGQLIRSIQMIVEREGEEIRGVVGTAVLHGLYLQTKGEKDKPGGRPWVTMGLARAQDAIQQILSEPWPV